MDVQQAEVSRAQHRDGGGACGLGALVDVSAGGGCGAPGGSAGNPVASQITREGARSSPVFDRSVEIARAGARLIPRNINVLIVEGNYVLLDQEPWSSLAPLFDVTVNIIRSCR